jgi:replicative DNA helicase
MTQRSLPHSASAERSVIGACLVGGQRVYSAVQAIIRQATDFYIAEHRVLWDAIGNVDAKGLPVEVLTLQVELVRLGTSDPVCALAGELAYESSGTAVVLEMVPLHQLPILEHARVIADHALARAAMLELSRALERGYRGEIPAAEQVEVAVGALLALERPAAKGPRRLGDVVAQELEEMIAARTEGRSTGITTGLVELNRLLGGGLRPKKLYVIAGRPGMGKSALAMGLARAAAVADCPPLVISLEMDDKEIAEREMAYLTGVEANTMRERLDERTEALLRARLPEVMRLPIDVLDEAGLRLSQVRAHVRRWALGWRQKARQWGRDVPLGPVVVDYLQLVRPELSVGRRMRDESEERQIGEVAQGLHDLAKQFDVPVVALGAVNRDCEKRDNKRPVASDLRGSGRIEAAADVIGFVYRDEKYNPGKTLHMTRNGYNSTPPNTGIAELIIDKQRGGRTGTVYLRWDAPTTTFEDMP